MYYAAEPGHTQKHWLFTNGHSEESITAIFRERLFFKPKMERVTQWAECNALFLALQD